MQQLRRLCTNEALQANNNKLDILRKSLSTATGGNGAGPTTGKLGAVAEQSAAASKLFDNVREPVQGLAAAAAATEAAEAAAGAASAGPSTAGRIFKLVANTVLWGGLAASSYLGYMTYAYDVEQVQQMVDETKKQPENSFPGSGIWVQLMGLYADKRQQLESEFKKYADPPSDKLLPDLPPHARHIKTLVLDLDDVLIHSDWTRGRGWRTFKRPGAEDFIKDMAQYYELVVYTSQLPTYADPILDRLDPQRMIQYRLYRDSTQYVNGKHVRDLSKLNRDLRQVLLITADADAYALQPENAIKVNKWKLEADDTNLLDLLPFLEAIVRTGVPDVRDVVRSYDGKDIPTTFKERMKKVQDTSKPGKSFLGGIGARR